MILRIFSLQSALKVHLLTTRITIDFLGHYRAQFTNYLVALSRTKTSKTTEKLNQLLRNCWGYQF